MPYSLSGVNVPILVTTTLIIQFSVKKKKLCDTTDNNKITNNEVGVYKVFRIIIAI